MTIAFLVYNPPKDRVGKQWPENRIWIEAYIRLCLQYILPRKVPRRPGARNVIGIIILDKIYICFSKSPDCQSKGLSTDLSLAAPCYCRIPSA